MEIEKRWAETLSGAASGKPGTIKGRLLAEDKSQRYKQLAEVIAAVDRDYPAPRLAIDAWLNLIDYKRQVLPESATHDLRWLGTAEIAVGNFELHVTVGK